MIASPAENAMLDFPGLDGVSGAGVSGQEPRRLRYDRFERWRANLKTGRDPCWRFSKTSNNEQRAIYGPGEGGSTSFCPIFHFSFSVPAAKLAHER